MNISALMVFVFAVMTAYVYANIPCSDCNDPCSDDKRHNVAMEIKKFMNFPHCRKNPKWECKPAKPDMDMIWPMKTYLHAKCGQCENKEEAKPIEQDFNMLFRRICKGTNNHTLVLELKPIKVSLGCMC